MASKKITVTLKKVKETKGAIMYLNSEDPHAVTNFYIKKEGKGGYKELGEPEELKVTIETV